MGGKFTATPDRGGLSVAKIGSPGERFQIDRSISQEMRRQASHLGAGNCSFHLVLLASISRFHFMILFSMVSRPGLLCYFSANA